MKKDCKLFLYITLAFCLMIVSTQRCLRCCFRAGIRRMGKYFIRLDGEKAKGLVNYKR